MCMMNNDRRSTPSGPNDGTTRAKFCALIQQYLISTLGFFSNIFFFLIFVSRVDKRSVIGLPYTTQYFSKSSSKS
ncbi:hypothetical protein HanPSC8_Chr02g0070721 [Helianthus annuus]|nr:hypothetical protein HanPSC8_Chr02g0070721 [Helianthus annuus]